MSLDNHYKCLIATESNLISICNFLKNHFKTSEPLHEAFKNATGYNTKAFKNIPITVNIQEGLSLIATDGFGNIVGVIENATLKEANNYIPDTLRIDPMFRQIGNILDSTQLKITSSTKEVSIKEMEIKIVAVHKNWRQQGIAKELVRRTIDLAREKGFAQIRTICTGAYSKKMFTSIGFDCVCSTEYKEFMKQGKLDVLPFSPHTNVSGMILKI